MSLFKKLDQTVKRMVKVNIYGRKIFCRIDPRLAVNRKKEELLKKVLHAQKHFPQPMSERNTTTGENERPQKVKIFSDLGGRWNKIKFFSIETRTLEEQQVTNREKLFSFRHGVKIMVRVLPIQVKSWI